MLIVALALGEVLTGAEAVKAVVAQAVEVQAVAVVVLAVVVVAVVELPPGAPVLAGVAAQGGAGISRHSRPEWQTGWISDKYINWGYILGLFEVIMFLI